MPNFEKKQLEPVLRITGLYNVSYYDLPEDFAFAGEAHPFWELSYVDRGQVAVQHGKSSYLLKAGEMLFCKPDMFHTCRVWQDKPASMVDIAFSLEGTVPEAFENAIMILSAEEKQCMAAIVREAAQTYVHFDNVPGAVRLEKADSAPYGSEQIIGNRLEELMIYACRSSRNIRIDSRLILADTQPGSTVTAARIREYLQAHYAEKLTLERIAQAHCISVTKLKRVFREETGGSVMACLSEVRIKQAKALVRAGKLNFSQIAEAVGYDNIHYFSAVFKKHTGITLTDYARSVR